MKVEYPTDEEMDTALTEALTLLETKLPTCAVAVIAHHGGSDPTTMVMCAPLLPQLNVQLLQAGLEAVSIGQPEIKRAPQSS